MKIKFEIDNKKRKVIFFVKNGQLEKYVKALIKKYGIDNEKISKKGSEAITYVLGKAIERISELTKKDIFNYTPNFVFYKKKYELPIPLQR